MTIRSAQIKYNSHGTPIASDFDDVYFSNQNGLAESEYVFIQHNRLPQRWLEYGENRFVIAETGFGTGLNFLALWRSFAEFRGQHPDSTLTTLHFISTEKFPLSKADLEKALEQWPALSNYSQALVQQYPHLLPGCHRMVFGDYQIVLDLWFGDIQDTLPTMQSGPKGLVDAWFLDGFAPSKNPQMWSDTLFSNMARLSKPSASFATFTAAGLVKRGLKESGFEVNKVKGFGRKREMLMGSFSSSVTPRSHQRIHYRSPAKIDKNSTIAIIGAGIAAANLAHRFCQLGYQTQLFSRKAEVADGASGNPQGGFYPQLNAQFNIASQIQACAFSFASHYYKQLLADGYSFAHSWCGVLQLAFNDAVDKRQQKLLETRLWPESMLYPVNPKQASKLAQIPLAQGGLFIPDGGWISPVELVKAMCQAAQASGRFSAFTCHPIDALHPHQGKWQLLSGINRFEADLVIIAAGDQSADFSQTQGIPFQHVRGQVESIDSQAALSELSSVLCHKGYLTPQWQSQHALGSTYVKNDRDTGYRMQEQQTNKITHNKALQGNAWAKNVVFNNKGRAAIRCSVPDHLPVVGNLFDQQRQRQQFSTLYKALPESRYPVADNYDNLYVLSGLGSRGLTTAPLMAELLVSQILGAPLPFDSQLLQNLNPNRFLIKDLIRRVER